MLLLANGVAEEVSCVCSVLLNVKMRLETSIWSTEFVCNFNVSSYCALLCIETCLLNEKYAAMTCYVL